MPNARASRAARRAAHAPPPPRSKARGRTRQADPRVLVGAAAIAAVVAVAIVLGVVLTRGSSTPANVPAVGSIANGLPGAAAVHSLFKGVPQNGTTLGRAGAPVTMVEYVDLQCPYCRQFETQVVPGLVQRYVRAGILKIELRPWAFIGPDSIRGQAAVLAAAEQNRAFDYAALLYDNQGTENTGWLNDNMVTAAASSIPGLRVHDLLAARGSSAVKSAAANVDTLAKSDGVSGTPTIFVGKSGTHGSEVNLTSPTDAQAVVAAIAASRT